MSNTIVDHTDRVAYLRMVPSSKLVAFKSLALASRALKSSGIFRERNRDLANQVSPFRSSFHALFERRFFKTINAPLRFSCNPLTGVAAHN